MENRIFSWVLGIGIAFLGVMVLIVLPITISDARKVCSAKGGVYVARSDLCIDRHAIISKAEE